jgi:hypothetical protein
MVQFLGPFKKNMEIAEKKYKRFTVFSAVIKVFEAAPSIFRQSQIFKVASIVL